MKINIRDAKITDSKALLDLFSLSYKGLIGVPDSEFGYFQEGLEGSFDETQHYRIKFFIAENEQDKIVSFAGIASCQHMANSWELRWGTTHPDCQRKGLMSQMTQHRINYAKEKNSVNNPNLPGIIQIASRQPGLYKKVGFRPVFERNVENYALLMIKEI